MELKLIKDQVCPCCGARTVAESCPYYHSSGDGFEQRTFECGAILSWSPNFDRLEQFKPCPKNPKEMLRTQQRRAANDALLAFIQTLPDVDEEWRKHASEHFVMYGRRY